MLRVGLVIGLIVVGALVGAATSFAPLYLAIPIGLVLLVPILLVQRREAAPSDETERNRLGARRQRFTERDRETLGP